jgi:hypothetical protein
VCEIKIGIDVELRFKFEEHGKEQDSQFLYALCTRKCLLYHGLLCGRGFGDLEPANIVTRACVDDVHVPHPRKHEDDSGKREKGAWSNVRCQMLCSPKMPLSRNEDDEEVEVEVNIQSRYWPEASTVTRSSKLSSMI